MLLAVLVPPPRVNLVRYHGVFVPGSKLRSMVVPMGARAAAACPKPDETKPDVAESRPLQPLARDKSSYGDWASLLKRVFQIDILACAKCGGRMKILAVIDQPDVVTKILGHLGMPTVPEGIPRCPAPKATARLRPLRRLTHTPAVVAACLKVAARDRPTQPCDLRTSARSPRQLPSRARPLPIDHRRLKRPPIGPIRPNRSYPFAPEPAWGYGRSMLARFLATLLLAVIVVAPGARAAETAAVVVDATTAQALSELTTTAAARHKVFDVISSADVRRALEFEANKQIAGCSAEVTSCMAEIAGAMGARYVVFGSVAAIGSQILLSLNLFDTKLATSAGRVSVKAASVDDLLGRVDAAVDVLLAPAEAESQSSPSPLGAGATPERTRLLMMDLEHTTKPAEPPPPPVGGSSVVNAWSTGIWMLLGGSGAVVLGGLLVGGGALCGVQAQAADTAAAKEGFQDDAVRAYGDRDRNATLANLLFVTGAVVLTGGIAVDVAAPFFWE